MNNNTDNKDTIVALITPPYSSAISIIRISGNKSISIIDKLFISYKKKN